jgi:hypothetical protein
MSKINIEQLLKDAQLAKEVGREEFIRIMKERMSKATEESDQNEQISSDSTHTDSDQIESDSNSQRD